FFTAAAAIARHWRPMFCSRWATQTFGQWPAVGKPGKNQARPLKSDLRFQLKVFWYQLHRDRIAADFCFRVLRISCGTKSDDDVFLILARAASNLAGALHIRNQLHAPERGRAN